jgi:hypothetical protein
MKITRTGPLSEVGTISILDGIKEDELRAINARLRLRGHNNPDVHPVCCAWMGLENAHVTITLQFHELS